MSITLHNRLLRDILLCTTLGGVMVSVYAQGDIKLRLIPMVEAPIIEKKILRLNVDFVFNHCPQEYWIYYNQETKRLIIEFFGIYIDAPPLAIKGTSVVSDLIMANNETKMALNGKSAQISMAMKDGWHYESWIMGGKVLRLQLWTPLNPNKVLKARQKHTLPMVLTTFGIAGITLLIIGLATNSFSSWAK